MKARFGFPKMVFLIVLALAACRGGGTATPEHTPGPDLSAQTPAPLPSRTENFPQAPLIPVPTGQTRPPGTQVVQTATLPPTTTKTLTPTQTPSPLPSPTPTSLPKLNVLIVTCDTGIDLFNRLGEVTNAYVRVQNVGQLDANGVQVRLEGSDEEKPHPDQSYQVDHLPAGYEIALKLTVDTQNGKETSIRVTVTSDEKAAAFAIKDSCHSRWPNQDLIGKLGELFKVRQIEEGSP